MKKIFSYTYVFLDEKRWLSMSSTMKIKAFENEQHNDEMCLNIKKKVS